MTIRTYIFPADSCKAFMKTFMHIRKDFAGRRALNKTFPLSACYDLLEGRYLEKNWNHEHQFIGLNAEQYDARKGTNWEMMTQWQTGWCYGGLQLPVFVAYGTPESKARARKTMDFIANTLQAPSGFFYAHILHGKPRGDFWKEQGKNINTLLIRRHGDMIHSMIKVILTLRASKQDDAIKQSWLESIRKATDAIVRLWQKNGQLGQFIDIAEEEILVAGSTSGASLVLALAEAGHLFDNEDYIGTATEIGDFFDEKYLSQGYTCGGPGEAGQVPDSESCFALLEGYWALYESTQNQDWLELACDTANLFASWVVSYDFRFPTGSFFDRAGIKATGTVIANSQNRHSAPGICTASGDVLLKLFRATDDLRYLDLAQEIAHALPQFVSREECMIPNQEISWVNERVNLSDWEGRHMIGDVRFGAACWCENSVLLTTLDFPSVYILPDLNEIRCFDHVEISRMDSGRYVIHNPTNHDARVRILVENAHARKIPWGYEKLHNASTLNIPAGHSVVYDPAP